MADDEAKTPRKTKVKMVNTEARITMSTTERTPSTKDQNESTDDIPFIHWEDEDQAEYLDSPAKADADLTDKSTEKASTDTMESQIDKMLELYLSLNDKIQKSTSTSKERLGGLKTAHNSLISVVKAQRSEIVDCYTRINDLEHASMQVQCDLVKAKNLIFDLISTVGMLNTRVEEIERVNLDQSVEIKERKLILAGIPESKKENIKQVALEKLKLVLTKANEAHKKLIIKAQNSPPTRKP